MITTYVILFNTNQEMLTTLALHEASIHYLLISTISIDLGDYLITFMLITLCINRLSRIRFTIN